AVYKQSTYNKAYKEGMEVNCKYVRRKQLSQYLSQETLDKYKPKHNDEGLPKALSQKRKSDAGQIDLESNGSESSKKMKTVSESENTLQSPQNGEESNMSMEESSNSNLPERISTITELNGTQAQHRECLLPESSPSPQPKPTTPLQPPSPPPHLRRSQLQPSRIILQGKRQASTPNVGKTEVVKR
ncbi:unnamed protein product, partial [Meganyctiphanes norvegica]